MKWNMPDTGFTHATLHNTKVGIVTIVVTHSTIIWQVYFRISLIVKITVSLKIELFEYKSAYAASVPQSISNFTWDLVHSLV